MTLSLCIPGGTPGGESVLLCSSSGSMRSISKMNGSNNHNNGSHNGGSNGKLNHSVSRGHSQKSRSHTRLSGMTSSSSTASSTAGMNMNNNNNATSGSNNLSVPKERSGGSGTALHSPRMGMDNPLGRWIILEGVRGLFVNYVRISCK